MAETVIETRGLVKRYGEFTAVDGLDLEVQAGEVFGLLGPNGAGKTTTILMLLGLTEPTEGWIRVLGHDPVRDPIAVKRVTGYLPDNVGFYDDMTGRQNLMYTAELNGIPRREAAAEIDRLLTRVGLAHAADTRVGAYSRGMRQRLGVADVLLKRPRVVIMDEPTLGLDPEGARAFLELIRQLADEGMTVMLSSHLLYQVQEVCDRVAIFVKGQMIACGRVDELADQALAGEPLRLELELAPCSNGLLTALEQLDGVAELQRLGGSGESVRLALVCRKDLRAEVTRAVASHGAAVLHLSQAGRSLDDIYRRYFADGGETGGRSTEGAA
ncbi:ABC transporter ATP-binding protein [Symbiobacterium thermophilum]|uniref:ABC transporter ATP-binding protein n=1 Tax=Symbiobacterium thermophilum TaxID=2734 RepID=A0A953LKT2_SYMTR|nr:ABC transporter ATP-binding protein [Symbiobacterium thermophilum]MBY6277372.1 ABC transporter ATP-binding protein [Symbiobacterium thermophilum]